MEISTIPTRSTPSTQHVFSGLLNNVESLNNNESHIALNDTESASKYSKDIVSFPNQKLRQAGWICNVSADFKFSQTYHEYLQIDPSMQHSQFFLICNLLAANTCRVIYFDANFTNDQLLALRELQSKSNTELFKRENGLFIFRQGKSVFCINKICYL